jgi:hypothetical protein
MLKKMMLLAGMALAVVAFAGPASASAAEWIHNVEGEEVPAVSGESEDFTGFAKFEVTVLEGTSFGCVVHAHVVLGGGSTANVTGFEITTSTCVGEGLLAGCELSADQPTNLPWTVAINPTDFSIANVTLDNRFKEGCFFEEAQLKFPSITAVPNNRTEITTLTLSGAGEDELTGLPLAASGVLTAYHPGTYGVK